MTPNPPLRGLRFALVGPGRVGTSLARWAIDAGAQLHAVLSRDPSRRLDPLLATSGAPHWHLEDHPPCDLDLVLVAVSDSAITPVAQRSSPDLHAATALHTSGSQESTALAPLAGRGMAIGSLHPLRAFPRPLPDPGVAPFFAIDGDPLAQRLARRLASAFGGSAAIIEGSQRRIYHLAASLAAGGVMTVLAAVDELRAAAELPREIMPSFFELTRGALDAVEDPRKGVTKAITGPAARGDQATLAQHLIALGNTAPQLLPLVEHLHRETARLVTAQQSPKTARSNPAKTARNNPAKTARNHPAKTDPQENDESDS